MTLTMQNQKNDFELPTGSEVRDFLNKEAPSTPTSLSGAHSRYGCIYYMSITLDHVDTESLIKRMQTMSYFL
jgi:hypothetical protein